MFPSRRLKTSGSGKGLFVLLPILKDRRGEEAPNDPYMMHYIRKGTGTCKNQFPFTACYCRSIRRAVQMLES